MISEDIFRMVMKEAKEVPRIVYIARYYGGVIGYYDTHKKAVEAIYAKDMDISDGNDWRCDYQVLTVDLEVIGAYRESEDPVTNVSKILAPPLSKLETVIWKGSLDTLREMISYGEGDTKYYSQALAIRELQEKINKLF